MHPFSRPTRRAVWTDARFLLGIVLVAISIGGVWLILSTAGSTTPVLQAARTIVQGEALSSSDFRVVEVNLANVTDSYLAPQDLDSGQIAARTLTEGELVPSSATTPAENGRTTTIVIPSSTRVPEDVAVGSVVEIWFSAALPDDAGFDTPRILIPDAIVASVSEPEGMLSSGGTSIELVVARTHVADALSAVTSGAALSIIPTGSGR